MYESVRRAIQAKPELTAELLRRGMFLPDEKAELLGCLPEPQEASRHMPLATVQFATLLAYGDAQFAACAVLRDTLSHEELTWLNRLLGLQEKPNGKRDELIRIVERALERETRNGRSR
jgi:hypothetical protein